jgi:hypothetical protein
MFQFESGDVGSAHDLVRRVHIAGGAVGLRITDLFILVSLLIRVCVCVARAKGVVYGWLGKRCGHMDPLGGRGGRAIRGFGVAVIDGATHFDLEEILGRSVDLLEGLLSGLGDGLHRGGVGLRRGSWGNTGR